MCRVHELPWLGMGGHLADRTQCHALPPQAPSASTFSSSLLCTLVPNGLCPSLPSSLGGWRVPVVPRHFPGLGTGSAFGHPNLDVRERTSESCLSWEGKGRGEEGKREAFPQLYEKWLLPKYLLQGPKCPQPPSPPEFQVAWLCTAPHRPPLLPAYPAAGRKPAHACRSPGPRAQCSACPTSSQVCTTAPTGSARSCLAPTPVSAGTWR